ncbi:hypothetical protein Tco_0792159 [Tanacetum coccineum]
MFAPSFFRPPAHHSSSLSLILCQYHTSGFGYIRSVSFCIFDLESNHPDCVNPSEESTRRSEHFVLVWLAIIYFVSTDYIRVIFRRFVRETQQSSSHLLGPSSQRDVDPGFDSGDHQLTPVNGSLDPTAGRDGNQRSMRLDASAGDTVEVGIDLMEWQLLGLSGFETCSKIKMKADQLIRGDRELEEFRQVRRDRDDTRGRLRRLESYVERRLGFHP